jgi:hypothetical protein
VDPARADGCAQRYLGLSIFHVNRDQEDSMNRRLVAAGCLAASPVLVSASHFLWPAHSEGSKAQQIAAAGTHSTAWATATFVETVGWLLLLPALVVLWQCVTGRGRRLTASGVWVSIAGLFGYYGAGVMNLVTIEMGRRHDPAAMIAFTQALKHDNSLFLLVVAPLLLGTLALVVVFAGLARAGWVGWWVPVAAFLAIAASQALSSSENGPALVAAYLPMTIACIVTASRLAGLRTTSTALSETAGYATA